MALKHLKKLTALGMALLTASTMCSISTNIQSASDYVISASAANDIAKGSYQHITWRIDSSGTLIIKADGVKTTTNGKTTTEFNIPDFYGSGAAPWYKYRSRIKTLYLQSNLNSIGDYAFDGLTELQKIYNYSGLPGANRYTYFPTTLKRVGEYAFADCTKLVNTGYKNLCFGAGSAKLQNALKIERRAFLNCTSIEGIDIYGKNHIDVHGKKKSGEAYDFPIEEYDNYAITIDDYAFHMRNPNSKLALVDFHDSIVQIGNKSFMNNPNLRDVKIRLSSKPIHKDAFLNTPYNSEGNLNESRGCFSVSDESDLFGKSIRNIGAATTLTGKIRIVNIFVDQKIDGQKVSPWNTRNATSAVSGTNSNNVINLNIYGSTKRITSGDIAARLDSVRSAMKGLQERAKPYGASFSWDMDTETNFYITLDSDDQLPFEPVEIYNPNDHVSLDSKSLYNDIISKTNGQINLLDPVRTQTDMMHYSYYTAALHQKGYDSVIYLAHINLNHRSGYATVMKTKSGDILIKGEEIAAINGSNADTIMHEICHLFGAYDYYRHGISISFSENAQSIGATLFTDLINAFPILDDLMFGHDGNTSISPLTAYSIGWRDNLDCRAYVKTYSVFFHFRL